ncbi:NAD(P)-dependent dehydrogenase (short-subunit alcohol dehydrogenase family) [Rhizobium azooxidifex]|uniref:NAD(P)-dependent dehydrogenase (Short-subunit alcohol dehydrogenase family) n=1 Tax=Mycoplana azooxidifex TaxID=1636188 RepID=A0A7W6D4C6_9HYPH|nr:SDR family oxidoreductase [Mycoplana azooxidifex]MBB3975847.1 NAD(P)-dependent dehydrogenase (short-subunit alcohol dehydrogenase family) [Mycoplana azooxidifex]
MTSTILITGTSSGIGRAAARLFAEKGWNVIATMRDLKDADALPEGDSLLTTRLDVQDPDSIRAAIDAGIARFSRIDALVNNAGYGQWGLFEALTPERVQAQFDVNLFGVMNVTRALLPHFRANGGGAVLNVSSGAGLFTLPMISLYCASKFALEGFTEALSYELGPQNIEVKLVIPHGGVTSTRFGENQAARGADGSPLSDYQPFVDRTLAAFARMAAESSIAAEDVATLIHTALTDGSDRLRYLIGDDARGFVKARRTLPDQDYVDYMRGYFPA